MGTNRVFILLAAVAILAAGCDEQRSELPTAPAFAAKKNECNVSTLQQLIGDEFTGSTRLAVNKLANNLGQYRTAGDSSSATYLGYQILDSIAGVGRSQGTPHAGSLLAGQVLRCMAVGAAMLPDSFTLALENDGAFAVRGWSVLDADPAVSADGAWLLQPPDTFKWKGITSLAVSGLADSVKRLFLAYGAPISTTTFSTDSLTSTVFDWATVPKATFSPGVLVGECTDPIGYIQHDSAASATILGYIPISCGASSRANESERPSFAALLRWLFRPEPLQAAALRTAGSRGTLSPFGKIDPIEINLKFTSQPGKSSNVINRYLSPTITVTATSKGGTGFGKSAFVWLEAYNNSGVFVKVCNNWAYTDATGVATFPRAYLNKAGGYTIVAKARMADGAPALPLKAPALTSLFNVKNSSLPAPDPGCTGANVYVSGQLPPPPGSPPVGS